MRLLALDTSQLQAAVCVLDSGRVLASETSEVNVAHSEALLPIVDRVLRSAGFKARELDAFVAGVGPGSFTGIRIGCATIKGLAQAQGKPVLGVSSLRALVLSAGEQPTIVAMTNAYQGQVFAGWFDASGQWKEDALGAAQWLVEHGKARAAGGLSFCGTGAALYWPALSAEASRLGLAADALKLIDGVQHVSPEGLGRLVALELKRNPGALRPYAQLQANYLRPSQAEIKFGTGVAK